MLFGGLIPRGSETFIAMGTQTVPIFLNLLITYKNWKYNMNHRLHADVQTTAMCCIISETTAIIVEM